MGCPRLRGRPDISTGNDGIVDGAHHMIPVCNATSVTDIYLEVPLWRHRN
jgi:hypothetical protein